MTDPTKPLPDAGALAAMQQAETADLEVRLVELRDRLQALPEGADPMTRAHLQLDLADVLAMLGRGAEAWPLARESFDVFAGAQDWQGAVEACDVLFRTEQEGSLSALGQGVWLAVTFPVDPALTVKMLGHIVDETPDDSDGAAVAAATGVYVVDLRTQGRPQDELGFFARQMLGSVARRHSQVETQDQFDAWAMRLELNDPDKFLVRLRNVVDVLVQDDWWINRDGILDNASVH
jgi:hypothetical protein